jgi:hypothetical protein
MVKTVRISSKSDHILEEIQALTGKSKIEIVEAALDAYRHYERMRLVNESSKNYQSKEAADQKSGS